MTTSSQTVNRNPERLRALWERSWLKGLLLVVAVVFAYQPAWHAGFIWDDDLYVTQNRLLTAPDGLKRIWFSLDSPSQYFPLTYTTFWLERMLWGLNPAGYHWVNILLHAVNTLLLWRLLKRLGVPGAWLAAGIFALHPVQVESVAWITERKNVLCLFFFLLALLAWIEFVEDRPKQWWRFYFLSLFFFALALCSKTTACTLPAALLLILWLKEKPVSRFRLAQIIPFLAMGAGMGLVTVWWERYHQGTQGALFSFGPVERVLIASHAVWFYLGKLVWPVNLMFSYPRWTISPANPLAYGWLVAGAGLGAAIHFARRFTGRGVEVAALFYVATLSPLLGFIMLYTFYFSFVADHYQYVASVGPIALAAAGISRAFGSFEKKKPFLRPALGGTLLLALGILTWRQCGMYADLETLWQTTIARNPNSFLAHVNLGSILAQQGQMDGAIAHFKKALKVRPDYVEACNNLGNALLQKRRVDEALEQFQKALEIQPDNAMVHTSFGNALLQKGRVDEAIVHYQKTLEMMPGSAEACCGLGNALLQKGRVDEAMEQFQKAIRLQPDLAMAHYDLGNLLLQKRQVNEAITCYQKALEIKPGYAEAHYNLGNALLQERSVDEAIQQYQSALEIKPDYAEAHINLGAALLQKGRLDDAAEQFQQAINLQPDSARAHFNLGRVFLSKGRPDEAMAHLQKALEIRPDYAKAHAGLGIALFQKGRVDEAIARFQKALKIEPDDSDTHINLGLALFKKGRVDEAIPHFQKTLEISPGNSKACYNLTQVAWVLATSPEASVRNGAKAVALVEQVEQFSQGRNPLVLETLAAAYAEAGRFPEAVAAAERAQRLAAQQGNASLADVLGKAIKLYQAGTPFRDTSMPVAPASLAPP
jgi:tetratricopeptide (TPR) repeat protein